MKPTRDDGRQPPAPVCRARAAFRWIHALALVAWLRNDGSAHTRWTGPAGILLTAGAVAAVQHCYSKRCRRLAHALPAVYCYAVVTLGIAWQQPDRLYLLGSVALHLAGTILWGFRRVTLLLGAAVCCPVFAWMIAHAPCHRQWPPHGHGAGVMCLAAHSSCSSRPLALAAATALAALLPLASSLVVCLSTALTPTSCVARQRRRSPPHSPAPPTAYMPPSAPPLSASMQFLNASTSSRTTAGRLELCQDGSQPGLPPLPPSAAPSPATPLGGSGIHSIPCPDLPPPSPAPASAQLPHGYCAAALSCAGQLYDWVDSWLSEADAWLDTQLTWLDRDTARSLLAGTLCLVAGGWAVLSLLCAALGRRRVWLVVESGGGGVGEGEGEGAAGGAPWVHAGWVLAGLVGGVLLGRQMRAADEAAASSRASKLLMDLLPSHIVAALLLEATDEEEDRKEEEEEEEGKGGGWAASLLSSKAGLTSTPCHTLIDSGHSHHNPSPPANLPPPQPEHAGQQQPVHAPANSNEGGLDTQPLLVAPPSLVPSSAADMPAAGQAGCRRVSWGSLQSTSLDLLASQSGLSSSRGPLVSTPVLSGLPGFELWSHDGVSGHCTSRCDSVQAKHSDSARSETAKSGWGGAYGQQARSGPCPPTRVSASRSVSRVGQQGGSGSGSGSFHPTLISNPLQQNSMSGSLGVTWSSRSHTAVTPFGSSTTKPGTDCGTSSGAACLPTTPAQGCLDAVAVAAAAAAVLTSSGTWQALPPLSCVAGPHSAAHSAVKTADALGHSAWVPPSSHLAKAAAAAVAAAEAATVAGVEGAGAAAAASWEGAAAGYRASQDGQSEGVMELKAAHMASSAAGPEPSHLGQPWPTVLGRCSSSSGMVVPGGLTQPVLTKQVSPTQALVELRQDQLQAVVGGQQGQPCLQLLHLAPPAEAVDGVPSAVGAAAAAGGSLGDGKAAAGASASGSCWLGIATAGQPMPRQRSTADAHERLSLVAAKGQQRAKAVDGPGHKQASEDPGLVSKSRTSEVRAVGRATSSQSALADQVLLDQAARGMLPDQATRPDQAAAGVCLSQGSEATAIAGDDCTEGREQAEKSSSTLHGVHHSSPSPKEGWEQTRATPNPILRPETAPALSALGANNPRLTEGREQTGAASYPTLHMGPSPSPSLQPQSGPVPALCTLGASPSLQPDPNQQPGLTCLPHLSPLTSPRGGGSQPAYLARPPVPVPHFSQGWDPDALAGAPGVNGSIPATRQPCAAQCASPAPPSQPVVASHILTAFSTASTVPTASARVPSLTSPGSPESQSVGAGALQPTRPADLLAAVDSGVLPAATYFAAGLSSSFPRLVQLGWAQASQVLAAGWGNLPRSGTQPLDRQASMGWSPRQGQGGREKPGQLPYRPISLNDTLYRRSPCSSSSQRAFRPTLRHSSSCGAAGSSVGHAAIAHAAQPCHHTASIAAAAAAAAAPGAGGAGAREGRWLAGQGVVASGSASITAIAGSESPGQYNAPGGLRGWLSSRQAQGRSRPGPGSEGANQVPSWSGDASGGRQAQGVGSWDPHMSAVGRGGAAARRSSSVTLSIRSGRHATANWHEQVSILFSDIVGFSSLSAEVAPEAVFAMLNELYSHFDELTQSMPSVYKIETIGDSYMVTAGLLVHDPEHAATMVRFGLAMQQAAAQVMMPNGSGPVQMRIGIHSGPVLSGVIGKIRKRFCLVGHTVNCASRMESGGIPGRIQVSSSTHALLQHCSEFQWESRGPIEVKGLGTMTPYLLVALDNQAVDILFPQDGITDTLSASRGQAATAAEELLTGQEYRPLPRDSLSCDPHKRASSLAQLPAASTSRGQCNIAEVSDTLIPHYGTGEAASAVRGELTTSLVAERKHAFVSNSSLELWKQRGHLQCEPVSSTERSPAAFDGFGQLDTVDVPASSTNATHENYLGQLSDIDGIESGFESALWDCASAHELHMSRIQGWSQEGHLSSNSVQAPASVSQSNSATWPPASLNADNHISTSCASPGLDGASIVDEHTARLARQRHDEEQALSAELYDVFHPRHMRRASCIWGLTDDPQPHMLAANHWHRPLADLPSTHTAVQTTHSSFAFTKPGDDTSCSNSRAGRGG